MYKQYIVGFMMIEGIVLELDVERIKEVNTVPEAVPVWPAVRYISNTSQYRCTVLGISLFYIFNIYIYIYYLYIYKFNYLVKVNLLRS